MKYCSINNKTCNYSYQRINCRCDDCKKYWSQYCKIYYSNNKLKILKRNRLRYQKYKNNSIYKLKQHEIQLKHKFKLSLNDYKNMCNSQNNVCAICKNKCSSGKRLAVDHDHKTGKVRGLLCNSCNLGLGKFNDSIKILQNAIKYMEVYASNSP